MLTRKPQKGDVIRWPHNDTQGVAVSTEGNLCWIDIPGRPTEPFIWRHASDDTLNTLAEIVEP
jgi:hypothetical protein